MPEPKKVEITLATKHVHGGREFARGDVLTLRPDQGPPGLGISMLRR